MRIFCSLLSQVVLSYNCSLKPDTLINFVYDNVNALQKTDLKYQQVYIIWTLSPKNGWPMWEAGYRGAGHKDRDTHQTVGLRWKIRSEFVFWINEMNTDWTKYPSDPWVSVFSSPSPMILQRGRQLARLVVLGKQWKVGGGMMSSTGACFKFRCLLLLPFHSGSQSMQSEQPMQLMQHIETCATCKSQSSTT